LTHLATASTLQSVHAPLEAEAVDLARYPNLDGSVKIRAAMVSSLDTNLGRVVEALNATNQLKNFVMVFTSVR
jgi:membrane-anchored protein YejM (alkaline phosphatase superfamily)